MKRKYIWGNANEKRLNITDIAGNTVKIRPKYHLIQGPRFTSEVRKINCTAALLTVCRRNTRVENQLALIRAKKKKICWSGYRGGAAPDL